MMSLERGSLYFWEEIMGKGRSIRGIQGLILFFGVFLTVLAFVASEQRFDRVEGAAQPPENDPARHAKFTGTIVHYVILGQGRGHEIHIGILDDGKGEDQWEDDFIDAGEIG
jgi:hypothetical protein